jgi:hypothetical protein
VHSANFAKNGDEEMEKLVLMTNPGSIVLIFSPVYAKEPREPG